MCIYAAMKRVVRPLFGLYSSTFWCTAEFLNMLDVNITLICWCRGRFQINFRLHLGNILGLQLNKLTCNIEFYMRPHWDLCNESISFDFLCSWYALGVVLKTGTSKCIWKILEGLRGKSGDKLTRNPGDYNRTPYWVGLHSLFWIRCTPSASFSCYN